MLLTSPAVGPLRGPPFGLAAERRVVSQTGVSAVGPAYRMSLDHDFLLVATAEHSPAEYSLFVNDPKATHLHDDILRYMDDSLRWIPTLNPAKRERRHGLNFWGPTAILADGAPTAARVFRGWAELLRIGPPELLLTGPWTQIEGEPKSGHFSQLRFARDQVVTALDRVAHDCERVADSGGAHFVLHLGI